MIKKIHHAAYRCKNSKETQEFYEGFLKLKLQDAFEINSTKTGRETKVLHTFFALEDGSCIAFFEDPSTPFEFKKQRDFDLHIAFEVSKDHLLMMLQKAKDLGKEVRGISDHGNFHSIYFRDPNGYVVELAAVVKDDVLSNPQDVLDNWNKSMEA